LHHTRVPSDATSTRATRPITALLNANAKRASKAISNAREPRVQRKTSKTPLLSTQVAVAQRAARTRAHLPSIVAASPRTRTFAHARE
jgi:hypothetical protein